MLDFDPNREEAPAKDAATLVIVRDTDALDAIEVFCVVRHRASKFLGGAVVFPGGKVDDTDKSDRWRAHTTDPMLVDDASNAWRALSIAACREAFEEGAILPMANGSASDDELVELRKRVTAGETTLTDFLSTRNAKMDLAALIPFARWITPSPEARRFDARFFLARAPKDQTGLHDAFETTSAMWSLPSKLLASFDASEIQLAPPTHRTLLDLAHLPHVEAALAWAKAQSTHPVCPRLVKHIDANGETMALTLPGDPDHVPSQAAIAKGATRYVLRDSRWLPEHTPRKS
jgi:8-oxo-dGTP pyrophosphatase MutT (NUDIX family)